MGFPPSFVLERRTPRARTPERKNNLTIQPDLCIAPWIKLMNRFISCNSGFLGVSQVAILWPDWLCTLLRRGMNDTGMGDCVRLWQWQNVARRAQCHSWLTKGPPTAVQGQEQWHVHLPAKEGHPTVQGLSGTVEGLYPSPSLR